MKRYSFQDVVLLVNGVELTGWADGDDTIQIKRRADLATDKMGAAGEMFVSVSADRSGEITVKLMQASASNKYLNDLANLQQAAGSRFLPIQVLAQDTFRNDLATGSTGYIKKPSEVTRGVQMNTQEWTFVVERLDLVFGAGAA